MTGLGLLKQFLGLEIEQSDAGIKVNQSKYAVELLLKFKIDECKASKFPFLSRVKLGDFGSSPLVEISLYRKLVGSLLYLTHSRPIFSYDLGIVARYMKDPHEIHWNYSNSIFHYVRGTKHFRIHYVASSPLELVGFTDYDWVGDYINRKSNLGYAFMIAHGPICW